MKHIIVKTLLLLSFSTGVSSQVDTIIASKWANALVHIEGVTDTVSTVEFISYYENLSRKLSNNEITAEEYSKQLDALPHKNIRVRGTCIFFEHNSRRYLITARHVLLDDLKAQEKYDDQIKHTTQIKDSLYREFLQRTLTVSFDKERIFSLILRIPRMKEIYEGKKPNASLMNLNAGVPSMRPFTFSSADVDLAIISLDDSDKEFADELVDRGYTPVTIDDIEKTEPIAGEKIFTLGFPGTSTVGEIMMDKAESNWASSIISIPRVVAGKLFVIENITVPNFVQFAYLEVHPGNSGGPVIRNSNGKLMGIVSAKFELETSHDNNVVVQPGAIIIKSSEILKLIEKQLQKERANRH